ncbi:MAG: hypothetical protein WBR18_08840, partial [Anaerolineales bacterium]
MPEPARAAERGSDMTADEAMVEEVPADQVTGAPKPMAAQPTPSEPVEPEEPDFFEAPDQPELGEEPDLEPEPELEATIEPTADAAEAPAEPEPPMEPVPEPLDATLVAAREALAEGDQEAALANYNRLIKGKRQLDNVVADLEAALEDEPDAPVVWQSLGDAYMQQGRTKQAVQAYNRGMEEAEVLDNARQALAIGDVERATTQYGMLIKKGKRVDEIIEDLENAVNEEQSAPVIWQLLGDAYMKADRLNDSIEAYRRGMDSV